jgi:hypothetical protein
VNSHPAKTMAAAIVPKIPAVAPNLDAIQMMITRVNKGRNFMNELCSKMTDKHTAVVAHNNVPTTGHVHVRIPKDTASTRSHSIALRPG